MKTKSILNVLLISYVFILLVLALCPHIAWSQDTLTQNNARLKVGVILPLSGDAASIGEAVKNGVTLGLEKLNPKIRERIELYYEDDALQPKNTITAFYKLLHVQKMDVLINVSSGTAKAIAPLAEQHRIPFLAVASDAQVISSRKYAYNFWVTPEEEAKVGIQEGIRRGYQNIASIITVQDGAIAIKSAFDKANNNQLKVVLDEEFPPEIKDFRPFLIKLKSKEKVDAIMVILLPGQCGLFAKQAKELGVRIPLFGFEMFEDSNEVKISQGALVGQWYVNADDPDNIFIDEYRRQFPKASLFGASNGHDMMLLIGAGLEKGFTGRNMHEFYGSVKDFRGALGVYSASGDNRFTLPAAVKVVTEDGFKKVG